MQSGEIRCFIAFQEFALLASAEVSYFSLRATRCGENKKQRQL